MHKHLLLLLLKLRDKLLHALTARSQVAIDVFVTQVTDLFFTVRLSKLVNSRTKHSLYIRSTNANMIVF